MGPTFEPIGMDRVSSTGAKSGARRPPFLDDSVGLWKFQKEDTLANTSSIANAGGMGLKTLVL